MGHQYTKEERKQIVELCAAGHTDREIARIMGRAYRGIEHARRRLGIYRKPEHGDGAYHAPKRDPSEEQLADATAAHLADLAREHRYYWPSYIEGEHRYTPIHTPASNCSLVGSPGQCCADFA